MSVSLNWRQRIIATIPFPVMKLDSIFSVVMLLFFSEHVSQSECHIFICTSVCDAKGLNVSVLLERIDIIKEHTFGNVFNVVEIDICDRGVVVADLNQSGLQIGFIPRRSCSLFN